MNRILFIKKKKKERKKKRKPREFREQNGGSKRDLQCTKHAVISHQSAGTEAKNRRKAKLRKHKFWFQYQAELKFTQVWILESS
jgi:hypothetical protein